MRTGTEFSSSGRRSSPGLKTIFRNAPWIHLWNMIAELITKDRTRFQELCERDHVSYLCAFGSRVTGNFGPNSNVDVLLDVDVEDDHKAGQALADVWNGLEDLFGRPVDLLTERSLKNPYLRKEIARTKKLIYDGSTRKVLV